AANSLSRQTQPEHVRRARSLISCFAHPNDHISSVAIVNGKESATLDLNENDKNHEYIHTRRDETLGEPDPARNAYRNPTPDLRRRSRSDRILQTSLRGG